MSGSTNIQFTPQSFPIDYHSKTLFLGSCFATNMASKFTYYALPHTHNPFGVLFNPLAIETLIQRAINKAFFTAADLQNQEDIWFSFEAHSSCNALSQKQLLVNLNTALEQLHEAINQATHVVITLGTAWLYRHIASNTVVANCHKVPNKQFVKELMTPCQVSESVDAMVQLVQSANPMTAVIWTVSPVRHIKDGIVENSRSKANLISGLQEQISTKNKVFYFPSYELLMDELRDYRYYEADLIHPNQQAIDYVWERFKLSWIHTDCYKILDEIGSLSASINHRPLLPGSNASRVFEAKLKSRLEAFKVRYPHIKLPK